MKKGLMKLSDAQLTWLGGSIQTGGRIHNIDVQIGCPWQCIICGVCAPKKSKNMDFKDFKIISDSAIEVIEKKDIDVLADDKIHLYHKSDFPQYHNIYKGIEKTAFHIAKDMTKRHFRDVEISTAGWKPGNTYMQRAMEDIVNNYSQESPHIYIGYSIKTVTEPMIREYKVFMDKNFGPNIDTERLHSRFIRESKNVARIVQNLFTLAPLNNTLTVAYEIQQISDEDINNLNNPYDKYKYLFSGAFMDQLEEHIEKQWQYHLYTNETHANYSRPIILRRSFTGLGNALNVGNITVSKNLEKNLSVINSSSAEEITGEGYHPEINCDGEIQIYYGEKYALSRILVPKEHFTTLAKQEQNKSKREEYRMLADLQGTNILR